MRGISVHCKEDVIIAPPDAWQVREDAIPHYEQPLGSESAVREFWSTPAFELGLPLFTPIYQDGFYHAVCWSGNQLKAIVVELDQLETHWLGMELPGEILSDLQERAGFLREALAVALKIDGCLLIG